MNKVMLSLMLIFLSLFAMNAQSSDITIKVVSATENEPLIGATVYFELLQKGAVTSFDGVASFTDIPNGTYSLTVSYIGFEALNTTLQIPNSSKIIFSLNPAGNELDAVVLQSTRSTRTIRRIPTRIELIGEEELGEKVMMNATNISMVLRESTGIQMQQTSVSSGSSNIKIQGLDGRYTQLLRDGFPLYGGLSSGLSVMQIPPLDLKQFEIIKGSSSTLYGGGAIAGLVDIVSKTPQEEPSLDLMFTQSHIPGSTLNIFYNKRSEKFGISLYGSGNYQKAYDPEDDDFSNLPETKMISFNPKFFYYPSEKTTFWFGVNGTYDDRLGGDMTVINSGQSGIHQYTEENISKRISTQAVYNTQLDSLRTINVKNSVAYFDKDLSTPNINFKGIQFNTFTEATYSKETQKADWIFGANIYSAKFDEENSSPLQRDQDDITFGLFANNIYDFSKNWVLETGFRSDYSEDWGVFLLPRVSLLFKNDRGFSSRFGGGLGYKIPDIFSEDAEVLKYDKVLAIDKDTVSAEHSYGLNFDLNFKTYLSNEISVSINQLFYVTAIKDALLLNTTSNGFYAFENASDIIISKGAETNIKFSYKDFRWFINYAFIDARLNYLPGNPQKPLTAKHNAGSVVMYEGEKWRIGYETYYTGNQILSNGTQTNDYLLMGLLVMRSFNWGNIFVNFENFTDKKQSDFSPLVLPPHEDPIFPEIYAPTDGFVFSAGIIIKPFGNNPEGHH